MSLGNTRARFERERILEVLEAEGWRLAPAAARLEMSVNTLRRRIHQHGLRRLAGVALGDVPTRARIRMYARRVLKFRRVGPRTWESVATT